MSIKAGPEVPFGLLVTGRFPGHARQDAIKAGANLTDRLKSTSKSGMRLHLTPAETHTKSALVPSVITSATSKGKSQGLLTLEGSRRCNKQNLTASLRGFSEGWPWPITQCPKGSSKRTNGQNLTAFYGLC